MNKTQLLGLLSIKSLTRSAVDWKILKFSDKAKKLNEQGLGKIQDILKLKNEIIPITSANESILLHNKKHKEAVVHGVIIQTANQANILVKDKLQVKEEYTHT